MSMQISNYWPNVFLGMYSSKAHLEIIRKNPKFNCEILKNAKKHRFANFVYLCIACGSLKHFRFKLKSGYFFSAQKHTKFATLHGYIFIILQQLLPNFVILLILIRSFLLWRYVYCQNYTLVTGQSMHNFPTIGIHTCRIV